MMDKSPDDWPNAYNSIADTAHVHAIGQLSLMYNSLEEMFGFVWQSSFPADGDYSEMLFHKLSNRDRVDMLSAFIRFGEKDAVAREHLLYALLCFNICTDNRNIVLHAVTESASAAGIFRLSKKARKDPARTALYDVPLPVLRQVADDAGATFHFWTDLFVWLSGRRAGRMTPLPDKPPQPHRLSPSLPSAGDAGAPPPPRSSRA
jgi:hypothetical protein